MKALSNFSLTILLSAFVVLPICNSTGNIITSLATTATPTYQETVLYRFAGGWDGANPQAGLIQGSDGNFYGTTSEGGDNGGYGTVFKITSQGQEAVLYSFAGGKDGASPYAGLIQSSDGNFYGTTYQGGAGGGAVDGGTVFKLTPQGVETVLHSFVGGPNDGYKPYSLIQGSDGNFYGTTYRGGAYDVGTVFKITPQGQENIFYSFSGGNDGAIPYAGLIQANDGNFYGTTYNGGRGGGTVFKVTPQGQETVLYSFNASSENGDGIYPQAGLIQGSDGNFYGTTYFGGDACSGTIFKVTPQGQETTLYSFSGGTDGANPQAGLIQGSDGNFYGTTSRWGNNPYYGGTVFKVTPQGQETTLYSFAGGTDGAYPYAGLIQANDGNFYGTTYYGGIDAGVDGYGTVFRITPQ